MTKRVYYRIDSRLDGQFDAIVTIEPANVLRRDGFAMLLAAEEWIKSLRLIVAATGAPVARDDGVEAAADAAMLSTGDNDDWR